MTRQNVFEIISNERDYQNTRPDSRTDNEKDVAEFVVYMEVLLNGAKAKIYSLEKEQALAFLRKTIAVGVACCEVHGVPERR